MSRVFQLLMKIILLSGLLLSASCSSVDWQGFINVPTTPYWEIQDSRLPEIAMIRMIRTGANVVIYNPVICQQIGDACGFFRLHAFAHDRLIHQILPCEAYPLLSEDQADCWAAKYGKPHEIYAAVQLISDEDRDKNLKIHGNPAHRAEHIRACAIDNGNWIVDQ